MAGWQSEINRGATSAVRAGQGVARTAGRTTRGVGRAAIKEGMKLARNPQGELIKLGIFLALAICTVIAVYIAVDNELNQATLIQYEPDLTFNSKQFFMNSYKTMQANGGTVYDKINGTYTNVVWSGDVSLDKSLWSEMAYRNNMDAYSICAEFNNTQHLQQYCSPKTPSKAFTSFSEHYNPMIVMAFTSEWGGYTKYDYSLVAFAPFTEILNKYEYSFIDKIRVKEVNVESYPAWGLNGLTQKGMSGPLQIMTDKIPGKITTTPYSDMVWCNSLPTDPFSWSQACDYYSHLLGYACSQTWNKDYNFDSPEKVLAISSMAVNSGPSGVFIDKSYTNGADWWVWKSGEYAWKYMDAICTDANLAKIKAWAKESYDTDVARIKAGDGAKYNLQCDANEAYKFIKNDLGINPADYGNISSGQATEKFAHPVQAIWVYYQMIWHYSAGGEE